MINWRRWWLLCCTAAVLGFGLAVAPDWLSVPAGVTEPMVIPKAVCRAAG